MFEKTPKVTILSDVVIPAPFGLRLHEIMENAIQNSSPPLYPPQESATFYETITPPPPALQPSVDPPQPEIIDLDNFATPIHVPDFNINASCSNQREPIGKTWRKLKEVYQKSSDEEEDEIEKDEEDEVADIKATYRGKIMEHIEEKWQHLETHKSDINEDNRTYKDLSPDRGVIIQTIGKQLGETLKNKKDQDHQALLDRCLGVMSKAADSFEIFGEYVADELRSMHLKAPDLQRHAKREIQRIILTMNDNYESRLQNVDLSQSQMSVTESTAIFGDNYSLQSVNSRLQTSSVNNPPSTSPEGVPIDDENDDTNIMNYYEKCGSTFFNLSSYMMPILDHFGSGPGSASWFRVRSDVNVKLKALRKWPRIGMWFLRGGD
ncbi:hypothetical protein FQR65_LT17170 [Abscondita terminalis]|nr:hypothetical protein FQR65_LT17170 [Abscondita terminalis]